MTDSKELGLYHKWDIEELLELNDGKTEGSLDIFSKTRTMGQ